MHTLNIVSRRTIATVLAACLLLIGVQKAFAFSVPELQGSVNDYASMLSPSATAQLRNKLATIEQQTGAQVVVLTIYSLDGNDIESIAHKIASNWALGQKGKDNGVLLLIAKNDRQVRIEVGMGLEGRLTDAKAGRIIDQVIIPHFKQQQADVGVLGAIDAIIAIINGQEPSYSVASPITHEPYQPILKKYKRNQHAVNYFIGVIVIVLFSYILGIKSIRKKNKNVKSRTWHARSCAAGTIIMPFYNHTFMTDQPAAMIIFYALLGACLGIYVSWIVQNRSTNGYYGGGFGGGSSGGFGGGGGGYSGGGGSFGGGGASGRW